MGLLPSWRDIGSFTLLSLSHLSINGITQLDRSLQSESEGVELLPSLHLADDIQRLLNVRPLTRASTKMRKTCLSKHCRFNK